MPNFKLSKKNYPCPVCGDTSGGCKERNNEAQIVWLCRHYVGLAYQEKLPGWDGQIWINLKADTGSGWATMAIDRSQEFSEQQRAEYEARRQASIEQWEKQRVESLAAEMQPEDRQVHYSKLLSELHLSARDRELLKARGFTDHSIAKAGFKSVGKYHRINNRYPDNLPGFSFKFGYSQLQTPDAGILCPITDHLGRFVGAQIRLTEVKEGKRRYRWLAQDGSGYLNGENPIACWQPETLAEGARIWLSEGTGIKPLLACQKLNSPVVGAAGGLFASSPINTRQTLQYLTDKHGLRSLTLAIDAGDVINPQVMHRVRFQIDWLQQEGYEIEVAWWNQVEKTADDIDELTDFSGVEYLSVADFLTLASKFEKPEEIKEIAKPVLINRAQDRKDEHNAVIRAEGNLKPTETRPAHWEAWLATRQYTPDLVQNSKYVEFSAPAPGTILAIKSGLGSGKTHQLQSLFGEGGAFENKGAIALFARNSLIFNFVKRVPAFSHLNEDLLLLMRDPQSCLALCTNSLKKFSNPDWFRGKILIIDEFAAVALHIACSSTHRKDRIQSLELFKQAFTLAESVIILDGMLTDALVNWAGSQDITKKIVKVENNLQRKKARVEILLGTPTKTGSFDDTKLSPYVAPMVSSTQPFIVFSDSQKLLEQLEKLLIAAGKTGVRIDSKTIRPNSEERIFLDNCNTWIELHRPDYALCSPTAESGVDISVRNYFKNSYGLFRGIVATDSQMQMMARYRCAECNWHISVPKASFLRGNDADYNLENINAAADRLMELAEMDISHLRLNKGWLGEQFLGYIEAAKLDVNNSFALRARTKENFEKDNLRECLHFALETAGHEVSTIAMFADGKVEADLKLAGEEVKKETSEQIFNAEDISPEEAERLATAWSSVWEDRVKLIKAGYKKLLPGIEETPIWSAELIQFFRYDQPKLISAAGLLHQFKNPTSASRKQVNTWAKIATERAVFLPDLHSPHIKIKALEFLNFAQFLDPDRVWTKDSPELLELCRLGKRTRIVNAIGFKPPVFSKGPNKGKADVITYLRKLLEAVGLRLGPCHKKREAGRVLNTYQIDDTWLNNPVWLEVQAAVDRRFAEFNEEWIEPEVLTVQVQDIATESAASPVQVPDFTAEPAQDADGVDWRGLEFKVLEPVEGLTVGDRVTAISQLRTDNADENSWLIWVSNKIGQFLLRFKALDLCFDLI